MTNENGNGRNATPLGDALHETAARGVEAIHLIVQQRDSLLVQVDRLTTENALLRERATQRGSELATKTAERDHYMRYTTELTTRLNNIMTLIASAVEESKHAAYKPTQVITPKVSKEDVNKLENLIARLPQNGGSDSTNGA